MSEGNVVAQARTDARDWLMEADEPLAGLQRRIGGELPGLIAAPALLGLVRRARHYGLKLARAVQAQDDSDRITAWVEVEPLEGDAGCLLQISSWKTRPIPDDDDTAAIERQRAVTRFLAELTLRLGPGQEVLSVESRTPELDPLAERMRAGYGEPWTRFVATEAGAGGLHWRLLDGAPMELDGSDRQWRAHLIPLGVPRPGNTGFELHFVAEVETQEEAAGGEPAKAAFTAAIGRDLAPVLRQPVARIIANAETIRTQLAGPLAEEYSNYAADIASAGEHLLGLLDDLADLEVVEDEEFTVAPDLIDMADIAIRAAGILGVRARERGIVIDAPKPGDNVPAIGEFRRALQILLNLLGNAIRYSPDRSQIWLRVETDGDVARLIVADQGEGLSAEQQTKVFEKFERLGRSGDGGSGLGLYISRRLARAMGGDLRVESAPGQGARFILDLPAGADD